MYNLIENAEAKFYLNHELRKKALAYKEITEKYGPSLQLMEFINFDKKLGEEIGLESFDSLSLLGQHEMLVASLDEVDHDGIALEAMGSIVASTIAFIVTMGIAVVATKLTSIGVLSIEKIVSKKIAAISDNRAAKMVMPYSDFLHFKKALEFSIKADIKAASFIPNGFSLGEWEVFYDKIGNFADSEFSEYQDKYFEAKEKIKKSQKVSFDKSGWTATNFAEAVSWYKHTVEEAKKEEVKFVSKLQKIQKWLEANKDYDPDNGKIDYNEVDDTTKHDIYYSIVRSIGNAKSIFYWSRHVVLDIERILDHVSKNFKEVS